MEPRHDMLVHGVYIVTAQHNGRLGGLAVAWGMQVARDAYIICVGRQSATRELILESKAFGVSALRIDQVAVGNWFGRQSIRDVDKFEGIPYYSGTTGVPLLNDCGACYECSVSEVFMHGSQRLIIGKVVGIQVHQPGYIPLIYREEDYPASIPQHPYRL